jgi:hypothetical protein
MKTDKILAVIQNLDSYRLMTTACFLAFTVLTHRLIMNKADDEVNALRAFLKGSHARVSFFLVKNFQTELLNPQNNSKPLSTEFDHSSVCTRIRRPRLC